MSPLDNVNPYAPSGSAADPDVVKLASGAGSVSSTMLCLGTMGVCTLAGSLFGLTILAVLLAGSFVFQMDRESFAPLTGLMMFAAYGVVVGGILGMLSAVPSVMLVFLGGMPWRKPDHRWDAPAIRRFAAVSGALAGFLPLTVASGLDGGATLFSIIPAIFGGFVARLLILPLARKAGEHPEPLSSPPPGNYPDR
jgi:hypothetical protein